MERTIGVILSGGQSRRMGRDKAGLSLAGQSFLDRMTKELSPLFDGIYVSVDRPGRYPGCRELPDLRPGQGPLAGLEARFGLRLAEVVEDAKSAEDTNNLVAARAYELCFSGDARPGSVGLGWGSMLGRMADYAEGLPDSPAKPAGRLFPLIGGIGASYRGYHTNELARIISGKAGYEAEYLYLPAFFDSEAELDFAARLEAYAAVQADWDSMELALVNISNFPSYPDLGVEYRFGSRLTEGRAVGRVLAHYYDAQGRVLEAQVNNALQAGVAQLKKAPRTVAVCSTLLRPQSVAGALALGVIDTLCLPLSLAQKVLDLA